MNGELVPDDQHVARYIAPTHIEARSDGPTHIDGNGFLSRPRDNGWPSVNWLELLGNQLDEQLANTRRLARIKYGKTGVLVTLNVGRVRAHVSGGTSGQNELQTIHSPLDAEEEHEADPSHALMGPIGQVGQAEAEMIGDLIAQCIIEVFPAVSK